MDRPACEAKVYMLKRANAHGHSQRRDRIRRCSFHPEIGPFSQHFWGDFLTNLRRKTGEKKKNPREIIQKIQWRQRPKLQMSVPCRGRTCPDTGQRVCMNFRYCEESKGCLIKGCMNPTKIPKVGSPKAGIPKTGIPKTGIPKLGIPKVLGRGSRWQAKCLHCEYAAPWHLRSVAFRTHACKRR